MSVQGEKLVSETVQGSGSTLSSAGTLLGSQNATLFSTVTYFSWKVPVCVADVVCGLLCAFPADSCAWHSALLQPQQGKFSALCWAQLSLSLILWVQVSSRAVCGVGGLTQPKFNIWPSGM